jgi:hypothetical protein
MAPYKRQYTNLILSFIQYLNKKIELGWLSVSLLKKKPLVRSQLFSLNTIINIIFSILFYFAFLPATAGVNKILY